MESAKNQLGIWMDHSIAYLIDTTNDPFSLSTIESMANQEEKQNFGKDESLKHSKEKKHLIDYFNELGNRIKNYKNVLLFGPTDAKTELFNMLKDNRQFEEIKIEIKTSGKLTENQIHAFVRKHFLKNL
jgi:stalled ribosome rescue protein Dom34